MPTPTTPSPSAPPSREAEDSLLTGPDAPLVPHKPPARTRAVRKAEIRRETGATLRLALPVVVTQLGMMAMGLVDTAMVGPLGANALAGVAIANSVYFGLTTFLVGVIMALDPMVSMAWGGGRLTRTGQLLAQGVWLAVWLAIPSTALFFDTRWLFDALRQPPEVARFADVYLSGRAWAVLPLVAFTAFRGFLNGVGDTRPVMILTLIAVGINVVADWVLIHGHLGAPALGVLGAGLATSLVRWLLLFGAVAVVALPRYRPMAVRFRRPDVRLLRPIVALGLPIGAQMVAEFAIFGMASLFAGWLGAASLAAHQIALSLAAFVYMVPLGLAIAASVRIGQELGAGRPDRAALAGRVALVLATLFMTSSALLFTSAPEVLVGLFSPDEEVLALGSHLLWIAALFQIADGLQVVAAGCLRGASDTRTALLINLGSHWVVGGPTGYLLAFEVGLGVAGLWWGMTAALTVAAVPLSWFFLGGRWMRVSTAPR